MNRTGKTWLMLQVMSILVGCAAWANAAELAAPDTNRGRGVAMQVCIACHGADGNSASDAYPKLAGQHREYLVKQLTDFKLRPGAAQPARNNPIMAGMAAGLSDQQIVDVAAYFAAQSPKPAEAHDRNTIALGQKIYRGGIAERGVPACAGCHGPAGQGIPSQFPRLSGQWAGYTAAQLTAFSQGPGARTHLMSPAMVAAAAVSGHLADVRPLLTGRKP